MAALTQDLVQTAAQDVLGTSVVVMPDGEEYDLGGDWAQLSMYGSLSESLGEQITPQTPLDMLAAYADKLGVETDAKRVSHGKLVELLWEHQVGDHLFAPHSCAISRWRPARSCVITAPSPVWWRSGTSMCAGSSSPRGIPSSSTR